MFAPSEDDRKSTPKGTTLSLKCMVLCGRGADMARVGCSIPNRFLIVAFGLICLCFVPRSALAQRAYGHPAGGATHIPTAPIVVNHAPISSGSAYRAPIPRMSTFRSTGLDPRASFIPPRRPIRRFPPFLFFYGFPFAFGNPFWGFNCWSADCDLFWSGAIDYTTISSPGPENYVEPVYASPVGDYDYGEESADTPQLYLKDGSIVNVKDYWLTDGQLHFTIVQEYGANPVEQVIPFEALDLQKTVDVNTRRGFRFVLRDEPFEQYVRDHPEGVPVPLTPQP
jgi:hypothetical protein